MARPGSCPEAGGHAEALAAAMTERGFAAAVFRTGQHKAAPAVQVTGRGCIYVAAHAGEWWYFSPSLNPVAPCRRTDFAASVIAAWPAPVWVPLYRTA
jgi:hypothetical protein